MESTKPITQIEAIKRLRFTIGNQYKSNATDIEALNVVLETIGKSQKQTIQDNRPFAKLLCMYITLRYEIESNDINKLFHFLSKDLKQPLDFHINKLSNKMRFTQLENFVNTLIVDATEDEQKDIEALIELEKKFWTVNQKQLIEEINLLNSEANIKNQFFMTANQILQTPEFRL
jgi:hypothetical protein